MSGKLLGRVFDSAPSLIFRMMSVCASVCASVCPTFRSPTISQKRFDRLLSNLTNTNLTVVSRVEKLLVSIGPRGVEEGGVGRKNNKGTWKFDFAV
jgi:hypothetical protein